VAPLPSLLSVIPGNHDAYLSRTVHASLFAKYFGDVATPDMHFGEFATSGSRRRRHGRHAPTAAAAAAAATASASEPTAALATTVAVAPAPTTHPATVPLAVTADANGDAVVVAPVAVPATVAAAAVPVAPGAAPPGAVAPPSPPASAPAAAAAAAGRPPADYATPPPGTPPSPSEDEDRLPREAGFPYVKLLGATKSVALVCLNSGIATSAFESCGTVGAAQAAAADAALAAAVHGRVGAVGAGIRFIVVAVHHPPRVCHGAWKETNRGLGDIWRVTRLCARWGVGLCLHGHNHVPYRGWMDGSPGTLIVDAGSGTYVGGGDDTMARYNVYDIDEEGGRLVGITARVWDPQREVYTSLPLEIPPRAGVAPQAVGT